MKRLLKHSRLIFLTLAILSALPVSGSFIGGLLWFSPYLFLITVLSSKSVVLLNLLGLAILLIIAVKRRFICRYLCPMGVVCDRVSKIALRKKKLHIFHNLGKTLALFALGFAIFGLPVFVILDPFYMFQTFFEPVRTGFHLTNTLKVLPLIFILGTNLFFPDSWCTYLCPLGGLQMMVADLKNRVFRKLPTPTKKSRRLFISSLAGLAAGILSFSAIKKGSDSSQIRPPSALPVDDYLLTCIRCGNCISACPTDILYPESNAGMLAFLAPAVDFSESYCLPDCNNCGNVCPSGAIQKFSLEEKKHLVMASVEINYERCLLFNQKECNQCRQYCAYGAVSYQVQPPHLTPVPVIDSEKCVGCAACKIVCPENVIAMSRQT